VADIRKQEMEQLKCKKQGSVYAINDAEGCHVISFWARFAITVLFQNTYEIHEDRAKVTGQLHDCYSWNNRMQ